MIPLQDARDATANGGVMRGSEACQLFQEITLVAMKTTVCDNHMLKSSRKAHDVLRCKVEHLAEVAINGLTLRTHMAHEIRHLVENLDGDVATEIRASFAAKYLGLDVLAYRVQFLGMKLAIGVSRRDKQREWGAKRVTYLAGKRNGPSGRIWCKKVEVNKDPIPEKILARDHLSVRFDEALDPITSKLPECAPFVADSAKDRRMWPSGDLAQCDPPTGCLSRGAAVIDHAKHLIELVSVDGVGVWSDFIVFGFCDASQIYVDGREARRRRCIDVRGAGGKPSKERHGKFLCETRDVREQAAARRAIRATETCRSSRMPCASMSLQNVRPVRTCLAGEQLLRNLTRGAASRSGHLSSSQATPPSASFQIRSAAGTRRTSLLDLAPAPTSSPGPFMRRA